MSNIQKQHKISPAIAWLTIQKFIIFYCPLDGEHTIRMIPYLRGVLFVPDMGKIILILYGWYAGRSV